MEMKLYHFRSSFSYLHVPSKPFHASLPQVDSLVSLFLLLLHIYMHTHTHTKIQPTESAEIKHLFKTRTGNVKEVNNEF